MMNALRVNDGFAINLFTKDINEIAKELLSKKDKKLIEEINGRIKPTVLGQSFLNELLQIFLRGQNNDVK